MPICQSSLAGKIYYVCLAATSLMWRMTRAPLFQYSPEKTEQFVFVVLAVALVTYARFVVLVISDITNYLGVACLSVSKKDVNGVWKSAVATKPSGKRVF